MSTYRVINLFRISRCAPISDLWANDSFDFTIIHGEERIPVHERVLVIWSKVFRGWFQHSVKESDKREADLSEHSYSTDSLLTFLKLLYCQQVVLDDDNVLMVYRWAHYFNVDVVMDKCVAMMKQLWVKSAEWGRAFIQTVIENDDHDLIVAVHKKEPSQRLADTLPALLLDLTDEIQYPHVAVKFVGSTDDHVMDDGKFYVKMSKHCIYGSIKPAWRCFGIVQFKFCIDMMQGNVALRFTENQPPQPLQKSFSLFGTGRSHSFPDACETDITLVSLQHPDFNQDNSIISDEKDIIAVKVVFYQLTISNVRTKQTETRFRTESGILDFCLIGCTVLRLLV
ncbi:hypothetical protein P9112_010493 [Eukaryota sp. TZLM1-RC]